MLIKRVLITALMASTILVGCKKADDTTAPAASAPDTTMPPAASPPSTMAPPATSTPDAMTPPANSAAGSGSAS